MPRSLALLLAVLAALSLAACRSSKSKDSATKPAPAPATTSSTPAPPPSAASTSAQCRGAKARPPALKAPTLRLDAAKAYRATVATNRGTFTIALDVRHSPKTSASFYFLARCGFFDRTVFHRIVPGFVIQGGDPLGNGTGGPGYSVVEPPPASARYTHGVVAMAKTATEAPGTSGSQFYVVTGPDAQLPAEYAILGRVGSGLGTVDRIGALPTDPRTERPRRPVRILRVTVSP